MIQHVILSDQVKEQLLDDILSGRYKPGDRLVESQIAKSMGISQSPVREALRDLVAMRFVEVQPHKGARVREINEREILEIYPVRASLEELAGTLAADKVADQFKDLEQAVQKMSVAFKDGDARTMAHWDVAFHRIIIEASGNNVLIESWNGLMIESRTFLTLSNLITHKPDLNLAVWHDPIIEALREGDPVRCGMEMRKHVEEFGKVMTGVIQSKSGTSAANSSTLEVS